MSIHHHNLDESTSQLPASFFREKCEESKIEVLLEDDDQQVDDSISTGEECFLAGYDMIEMKRILSKMLYQNNPEIGDLTIFFGNTGAGKSTLLNYLLGMLLEKETDDLERIIAKIKDNKGLNEARIGQGVQSETVVPSTYQLKASNIYLCDCPGFGDNQGLERDLCISLALTKAVKKHDKIRIALVINKSSLDTDRGMALRKLADTLSMAIVNPQMLSGYLMIFVTKAEGCKEDAIRKYFNMYLVDYQSQFDKIKAVKKVTPEIETKQKDYEKMVYIMKLMKDAPISIVDVFDDGESRERSLEQINSLKFLKSTSAEIDFNRTDKSLEFFHQLNHASKELSEKIRDWKRKGLEIEEMSLELEEMKEDIKAKTSQRKLGVLPGEAEIDLAVTKLKEKQEKIKNNLQELQETNELLKIQKEELELIGEQMVEETELIELDQNYLVTWRSKKIKIAIPAINYQVQKSADRGQWIKESKGAHLYEAVFESDILTWKGKATGQVTFTWYKKDNRDYIDSIEKIESNIGSNFKRFKYQQNKLLETKNDIEENQNLKKQITADFDKMLLELDMRAKQRNQQLEALRTERLNLRINYDGVLAKTLVSLYKTQMFEIPFDGIVDIEEFEDLDRDDA